MTTEQTYLAAQLGFQLDMIVQELGYDDDVDQELRELIEQAIGKELVGAEYDDKGDAVIVWFRANDGDLTDALVGALAYVNEGGSILLLTPKSGRGGYVEPSDIGEAALTAGLAQTKSINAATHWMGNRLLTPTAAKRR